MNDRHEQITPDDIHAYVDGQLNQTKRLLIEQRMQIDSELKESIEQYQLQNQLLHELFDPVIDEAIPESISVAKYRKGSRPIAMNIAAGMVLMFSGGVIGWSIHGSQMAHQAIITSLAQPAAIAHVIYSPEVKHPVEVGAEQEQHLVNWLSKRLGKAIKAPRLSDYGFQLMGGRLLPGKRGPAAQFMYENRSGERLTLYVRRKDTNEKITAFRYYQQNGTNAFYWIDGELGYVLSGDLTRQQLLRTANGVYQQLSP